jgi:lipopolysaccharide transport system permease protein
MNNSDEFDLIIEPGRIEKNYWKDLWRFRELFYILSWRDIKVRYKQTVIGAAWSIIRPLLTMIVFTVVFGKVANLPTEGTAPYIIMVYAAMLPWQFFSNSLTESSNSLLGNAHLISKVYFPRLIIPASSVIVSLVDFFISFTILLILFIIYQFIPSWHIIFLPFFILLAFSTAFGLGLLLTALNVKYRDFRYIIPFIVQLGLYISPVGFSSKIIPDEWKLIYSINPMVCVIDGFRWCIIGNEGQLYLPGLFIAVLMNVCFFVMGIRFFRKMEKSFADVI